MEVVSTLRHSRVRRKHLTQWRHMRVAIPHHQTYYVEHNAGVRPGDPLAFDYPIESIQDVLVVLTHLRTSLESDPDSWENPTLPRFLEAMSAWLSTFPQVYINLDKPVPDADWNLLADCLRAARIYE